MPIVRLVGYGRPAEISFSREPMFRGFVQDGWDYYFSLKRMSAATNLLVMDTQLPLDGNNYTVKQVGLVL